MEGRQKPVIKSISAGPGLYTYDARGHVSVPPNKLQTELRREFSYNISADNRDYLLIPIEEVIQSGLCGRTDSGNPYSLNSALSKNASVQRQNRPQRQGFSLRSEMGNGNHQ